MKESKRYNSEGAEVEEPNKDDDYYRDANGIAENYWVDLDTYHEAKTIDKWVKIAVEMEAAYRLSIGVIEMKNRQLKSKDKEIEELKRIDFINDYLPLEQELQRLREQNNEAFSVLKGVLEEYHINPFHAEQIKQLLTTSKEG